MDINKKLAEEFKIRQEQVDNTVNLLDEGQTIPFIARYRKELTGSLDDQIIRELNDRLNYLRNQVILIKPKIIVLLGSVALKNILGKEYGITASRGKWIEKKGILYLPTWHPAALLRDESKKIDFIKDLKLVMEKMEWSK